MFNTAYYVLIFLFDWLSLIFTAIQDVLHFLDGEYNVVLITFSSVSRLFFRFPCLGSQRITFNIFNVGSTVKYTQKRRFFHYLKRYKQNLMFRAKALCQEVNSDCPRAFARNAKFCFYRCEKSYYFCVFWLHLTALAKLSDLSLHKRYWKLARKIW